MHLLTTLGELLGARTAQQPHRLFLTYLESFGERKTHVTYGELDRQARRIAARLQTLAPPGARAIMLYPPGIDSVPAFFGALYAGLIPVPVAPPRPGQPPTVIPGILADAQTDLVLTTSASRSRLEPQFGAVTALRWVATDVLAREEAAFSTPAQQQPGDTAMLLYTSGSTSQPKGVMLSHANVLSHMRAANQLFAPQPGEHAVMWSPLYHGGGLIGSILNSIYSDYQVTILSPLEVLERPGYWLETISRTGAQFSSGANFLYQWCVDRTTPAERAGLDLSAWRIAFCGAEPIRAATLKRFAETFAPYGFRETSFCAAYGQTETTLLTTFRYGGIPPALKVARPALEHGRVVPVPENEAGQSLVNCGRPILETSVRVVEPGTRTLCPPDRVGEVWVAGPTVAQGYWQNPAATQENFQAYIAGTNEGPYFRTGDLGFVHDDELYIAGRLKDLIIVRMKNYYAQDIEAAVANAHPALMTGGGVAFGIEREEGEAVVLMHELKADAGPVNVDEIAAAIRATAARTLDLPLYAVVIVAANSLPRTPTGKLQRFLCRQEFLKQSP